jgi:hypothetical protein
MHRNDRKAFVVIALACFAVAVTLVLYYWPELQR